MAPIRVGIIGAAPERSWAATAHIPALQSLPEYRIVAVSTTRQESANAAAQKFAAPLAFDNYHSLVNHPEVDLVVVSVKVPHHLEMVEAASRARKNIYCEWPLGRNLAEAEAMAGFAEKAGIRTAVGLQARSSPEVNFIRDLISNGYIGDVLSTTLVATGLRWGPSVDQYNVYLLDKRNGATMITIPFGHTIDALCSCLGEFIEVDATWAIRRKDITVVASGESHPMTAHDQLAVTGVLRGGAVASVHYRGGVSRAHNFLWEIAGTEGELQVTASGGHAQMFRLSVAGAQGKDRELKTLPLPKEYSLLPELKMPEANIAHAYKRFATDVQTGTHTIPDFADAVVRHRMIDVVERAAETGIRQQIPF